MAAFHLNPLRRCRCGKPATVELRNSFNASFGVFCDGCGKRELRARKPKIKLKPRSFDPDYEPGAPR